MRFVAMGICLALGIVAGIAVGREIAVVFPEPRWLFLAVGAGVGVIVFAVLYFPLFRPIADIVNDRFAALNQNARTTRTGTGLDEIPHQRKESGDARPGVSTLRR
jgi:hypothetical protein